MLEFTKCSSFRISLTVGVSKNALSRANGLDVEGLINATGAPERSWTTAPMFRTQGKYWHERHVRRRPWQIGFADKFPCYWIRNPCSLKEFPC